MTSSCIRGGLYWILGKTSLWKELLSIGTGCPGQWLSHHPWRYLKDMQMWHLGTRPSCGLGSAGLTAGLPTWMILWFYLVIPSHDSPNLLQLFASHWDYEQTSSSEGKWEYENHSMSHCLEEFFSIWTLYLRRSGNSLLHGSWKHRQKCSDNDSYTICFWKTASSLGNLCNHFLVVKLHLQWWNKNVTETAASFDHKN